ncbi:MAG: hypothetical protein LBI13_08420 [Streptococcaceae bacterium]|jgi:hypothetical protein|nr:hypothetical protein [Streptococcaceae bacterium]
MDCKNTKKGEFNLVLTNKQLADLNDTKKNEGVYNVDPDYAKQHDNKPISQGSVISTSDGQKFKVIQTENGKGSGFQGMAVAPVSSQFLQGNLSQTVVVSAGTDPHHLNDLIGAGEGINGNSAQEKIAENFVRQVQKQVKNDNGQVVQLSGYSQSAYMLKVGANSHIPTTVFNGWFNYDTLTDDEKKFMDENSELFINFRHRDDEVVVIADHNGLNIERPDGATNTYDPFTSDKDRDKNLHAHGTVIWTDGTSHNIGDWKFDKYGFPVDDKGKILVKENQLSDPSYYKKKLKSGILSGSQKIALQTELARSVATRMRYESVIDQENYIRQIEALKRTREELENERIQKVLKSLGYTYGSLGEAKQIYFENAGNNRYDSEKYDKIIRNIKTYFEKKKDLAYKITNWVNQVEENDWKDRERFR